MDCKWCGSSTRNASYNGLKKGVFCCRRCELEWRKENPEAALAFEEEVLAETTRSIAKMRDSIAKMRNPARLNTVQFRKLGKEYSKYSFITGFLLGALQVLLIPVLILVAFFVIGYLGNLL